MITAGVVDRIRVREERKERRRKEDKNEGRGVSDNYNGWDEEI